VHSGAFSLLSVYQGGHLACNKYECSVDQELAEHCCLCAGRCFVFTYQVAALFCTKWLHDCHLEPVTSNQEFDSVSQCLFTWRTVLPNFIPLPFEIMEPWVFSARQHICYSTLYAIARPSVCPSVCPSVHHTGGSVKDGWS